MEFSRDVFILELYSGNGRVAPIMSGVLGCPYETIDINPDHDPTIVKDLLEWSAEDSAALRAKHLGRRAVIFASPPCEQYSQARTTGGSRDLEKADAMVRKVKDIAEELDALFVFVENPETGLLKTRDVIQFLPYSYGVDYCAYGKLYQKATIIWTSDALDETRFVRRRCGGPGACPSMIHKLEGKWEHFINLQRATYNEKISVPEQLVVALLNGALPAMRLKGVVSGRRSSGAASQQQPALKEYEVDYIQDIRMREGVLELLISWVGYDRPTWEPREMLVAPLSSYSFLCDKIMAKALKMDSSADAGAGASCASTSSKV